MPTALITGATGITGRATVQQLLKSDQWSRIITLSRSQQSSHDDPKIQHATIDLQGDTKDMASHLKDVGRVDYVFFCAYLADPDEGKALEINGTMLKNFIGALRDLGYLESLKRFILVNGLKQYGVHLGVPKMPMVETDTWLEGDPWPPNFYYEQQRILSAAAAADANLWTWAVTYPQDVIGVAQANFMNLATALGLYASVYSSVSPDHELAFPGCKENYMAFNNWTSAKLHAEFVEWAALEPKAGNQAFNVVNGDTESWQNLWPRLAERYGAKIPQNMFPKEGKYKDFESSYVDMPTPPPLWYHAEKIGLDPEQVKNDHSYLHQQIDIAKWAERPEVVKKWEELRDKFGLDQKTWDNATWVFIGFLLGRCYSCVTTMSKARGLGWKGYQDTWTAFDETLTELEDQGILPKASELRK
ncbi:hypothetical protein CLCR_01219 [Cladophialophora carrionii]|uniref:PRISE-like Rossmann-fold domain-containing protein n=1 Tax=Cladophialophora carrionii TaxID=86049 RepID=A0A1C1CCH4_9EURO|nr:hypothetical protein CLCR_01219 [Cladophialophora carrionii]